MLKFIGIMLLALSLNAQEKDGIDQIFDNMALIGIDEQSELLYGYFFYSNEESKLKELAKNLEGRGCKLVKLHLVEEEKYLLHVEKVESLSRVKLRQREQALEAIASSFEVDYDGWDVGNTDPSKPIITIEEFNEYLATLSNEELYENTIGLYDLYDHFKAALGFEMCLDRKINVDSSKFKLANCFVNLQQYDEGILLYEELLEESPTFEKAAFNLGALHYDLNNYDASEKYYRKVVEINPDNDQGYYGIAAALFVKKDFAKAKESCEKALQLNPKNEFAKQLLRRL